MEIQCLMEKLKHIDFFVGVPDSILSPLSDYLIDKYKDSNKHIIAANEGNALSIGAGHYLATSKMPCIYLQNSGLGNIINPYISLTSNKVYDIPILFIIGYRGEPGIKDEPQHNFQGEVTLDLLNVMNIPFIVIDKNISDNEFYKEFDKVKNEKTLAVLIKKNALTYSNKKSYANNNILKREAILNTILNFSKEDIIVSTTGKTSRELFELREKRMQSHKYDFLTVGSMGYSSSIALGIAINKPTNRIWCIDGDGAMLMHLGSLSIIGNVKPKNYVHVLINNESHESVGGQPTVAKTVNFKEIALNMGYESAYSVTTDGQLNKILGKIKYEQGPIFLEIKSSIGSRDDLGRPSNSPKANKKIFMSYLKEV